MMKLGEIWLKVRRFLRRLLLAVLLLALLAAVAAGLYYGRQIYQDAQSIGQPRPTTTPTRIFASPTLIRPGDSLAHLELLARLERLKYREVARLEHPGEFRRTGRGLEIYLRPFVGLDGKQAATLVELRLTGGMIAVIRDLRSHRVLDKIVLEPELLSSIYGSNPEEFIRVGLSQCPTELIGAVIAVEDHRFYKHHGIDFIGILRAACVNLRAGGVREGASTLTQQLVKNRLLTSERTFKRKFREAATALMLETIYPKGKILEFYFNEIYLGQCGPAGIYGFGQAARYFFDKEPWQLELNETALLAGLIRAPNYYSPYRHPQRAIERRNVVLKLMLDQKLVDRARYDAAVKMPLKLAPQRSNALMAPYFVDFVMEDLANRYSLESLGQGGYRVFTTLDTAVQIKAERQLKRQLAALGRPNLDGALVVLDTASGEIRAMVGGRDYGFNQYNRAVKLRRNIGSLVKPFIYSEALTRTWHLSDKISDEPLSLAAKDGTWTPRNYDGRSHGDVMLIDALANSYNQATVRLGHEVGEAAVRARIRQLAPQAAIGDGPAVLLGAVASSPLEMAAAYEAFATGGTRTRPSWLKAVTDSRGAVVEKPAKPAAARMLEAGRVYLINLALERAVTSGTAHAAPAYGLPTGACGKTGTTDDFRESWFVGYTPRTVCCVWLGNDDFSPCGLNGAQGAMPVAAGLLGELGSVKRRPVPSVIVYREIDPHDGKLARSFNPDKISMPFVRGTEPQEYSSGQVLRFIFSWLRGRN